MRKFLISLLFLLSGYVHAAIGGVDIPNLSMPECMKINYSPISIYKKPEGNPIGLLGLDNPSLAINDDAYCEKRPTIETQIKKKTSALEVIEISYEHTAPAVYEVHQRKETWLKIKDKNQFFWIVKKPEWKYLSYEEDLVQGIETVQEFCTPQQCTTVSEKQDKIIKNNDIGSCYGNVYEVEKMLLYNGRKFYQAQMIEELIPVYGKDLPIKTYIPVYSKKGTWNGFYYSRGC